MSTAVDTGGPRLLGQLRTLSGDRFRVQIKDSAVHATNVQFQDLVCFHHFAAQNALQ